MIQTVVFDTKPYDRGHLQPATPDGSIEWRFLEFRLTRDTASTAKSAQAVCVFVNDQLDRPCLEALAAQGVKLVALRCTHRRQPGGVGLRETVRGRLGAGMTCPSTREPDANHRLEFLRVGEHQGPADS